jgi:hypothetical protein
MGILTQMDQILLSAFSLLSAAASARAEALLAARLELKEVAGDTLGSVQRPAVVARARHLLADLVPLLLREQLMQQAAAVAVLAQQRFPLLGRQEVRPVKKLRRL